MRIKTPYIILALVGLAVIFIVYTFLPTETKPIHPIPITETEAMETILRTYPELSAYKTTDLPPSSIESKAGNEGWYFGFIQRGSGLPGILSAKCYHVGNQRDVSLIGEYKKDNNTVADSVILETCEARARPISTLPSYQGLKLGETGTYGVITIKVISVEEDSRCPAKVNCIWAGQVRVKISVNGNESIVTQGKEFTTQNVSITLTDVLPRKTTTPINATDYRFVFTVTKQDAPVTATKCYVGGCSGQICSDKPDAVSTCDYMQGYSCYKTAKCERQSTGACGWTETPELKACLTK